MLGRKEIFADMKALVASFPGEMSSMRSQLENYKETAGGIHSLRADVQSLSGVLCRKVGYNLKQCMYMLFHFMIWLLMKPNW